MGPFWLLLLVLPSHHGTSAAPGVYTAGITPTSETYLDPCWDPHYPGGRSTYHPALNIYDPCWMIPPKRPEDFWLGAVTQE